MFYPCLTHRAFRDFNFCSIWDPTLRGGPSFEALFRLTYEARQGDRSAALEFGDTMYYTLRPAAFEAYQRAHGPHAFTYAEWFYSKIKMFFEILLYEWLDVTEMTEAGEFRTRVVDQPWRDGLEGFFHHGDLMDDEEIEEALVPEDNERLAGSRLVYEVSTAKTNRADVLRDWLRHQPAAKAAAAPKATSWGKNRERNQIILNCLEHGMERADICKELDRGSIATQFSLQRVGLHRWADAWEDPDGRQSIQQLFSKLRLKRVKPRAISK
jgi:hypothetical protein